MKLIPYSQKSSWGTAWPAIQAHRFWRVPRLLWQARLLPAGEKYHTQLITVIHPPRTVPVHILPLYKEELDKMITGDVITAVDEPTDWVNSIVCNIKETSENKKKIRLKGCPIYPHRVESSIVGIDSSQRKSSGERRLWDRVGKVGDSTPLESLLLVLVKVDSTYWKSSGERRKIHQGYRIG